MFNQLSSTLDVLALTLVRATLEWHRQGKPFVEAKSGNSCQRQACFAMA